MDSTSHPGHGAIVTYLNPIIGHHNGDLLLQEVSAQVSNGSFAAGLQDVYDSTTAPGPLEDLVHQVGIGDDPPLARSVLGHGVCPLRS